jgi:hypothetical protein
MRSAIAPFRLIYIIHSILFPLAILDIYTHTRRSLIGVPQDFTAAVARPSGHTASEILFCLEFI